MIIAIDGPAASGKSSVAKLLAEELGYVHLSTGLMYRALTAYIVKNKLLDSFPKSIIKIINELIINISGDNLDIIKIDDVDYQDYYNSDIVNKNVSLISSIKEVRTKMVNLQRSLKNNNLVCEGRDIGTVVFPNANKKFFLNASIDCRVNRRYFEFKKNNHKISKQKLKILLINRDELDKSRTISPLKIADDAIVMDTTDMTISEVVNSMKIYIKI